ncbi:MAG: amino acid ABC transporter substrate-binding protein [Gammaproteobacteria bacterium]|nr:amino acid ABC transporter substrate-binding protein [Gammaproteobacteria bacterium]MBU1442374.1 amino acid ABC transporter substrate-binding protein [Gammaproteobacteria bacterium]MBU2285216.1 amino acid ABC transporter substrate-binding protein [Gammaproteobacteria bacterium]
MNSVAWKAAAMFIGLCAALPQAQAGPTTDRIRQTGRIVIAYRESSVPLSYVDARGQPVGYAIDLCVRIAEAVKQKLAMKSLEVSYRLATTGTRIPLIVDEQADLECGSTTNNAERRKQVAFTIPHYISGARYLVRADSTISELADFATKKLASTRGTTPLAAIQKANKDRYLGIDIVDASEHEAAVEMLARREIDGFAMDDVLLFGLRSKQRNPQDFKVVGKFLTVEPLAIMMSKNDPDFKLIVDDEMRRLIVSREAYDIYDKWFRKPIPPNNIALDMPMNYLTRDFWKFPTDQVPN